MENKKFNTIFETKMKIVYVYNFTHKISIYKLKHTNIITDTFKKEKLIYYLENKWKSWETKIRNSIFIKFLMLIKMYFFLTYVLKLGKSQGRRENSYWIMNRNFFGLYKV